MTSPLWGRMDFMIHWDLVLRQAAEEFTLIWRH
jgi:hypothetical protein